MSDRVNYIASQGPVGDTVVDFWRMVVQFNVDTVLMLCNLTEIEPSHTGLTYATNRLRVEYY